ncbi:MULTISPECIES: hypothetical protein [unclassified Bacillus (in: firmicutes)]|uniref:hypothetical protein n=1 Tax=unclassified Bacillus (in: firmicutes) TaxID=185979 RepID=UPI001BE6F9BB|nr:MULTISPECIES: hypothetical protein [unclassified Bacillus (in: firmicutes)]MBT2639532.1 hypothetical protein [Bacillus sp. ISL-39]MBT2662536.1 hypothetical protein [Bacillus sp. ISL-45]
MKWLWVLVLSIISVLFLIKGIELWSVIDHVDGDGIGITFLGFSINDRVLNEGISGYALGFTIASIIPLLVAANIALRAKIKKNLDAEKI